MFASKDSLLTRPSGGYSIARSVRTRSSASGYFSRTPASASNRKTFTWSSWVKRGALTSTQSFFSAAESGTSNPRTDWQFTTSDTLNIGFNPTGSSWSESFTNAVFRDISAWYHIVVSVDMTQATSTDRLKVYVNGIAQTFSSYAVPAQNTDLPVNNTWAHSIARYQAGTSEYFDGYLTEINFIDGQALTPSSFGETDSITGVWKPKAYSGTYGTNGFELNFSDNSSVTTSSNVGIGKDFSGNGNYWTSNNINVTAYSGTPLNNVNYDSMTDVPTLTSATAANYCVLNPLNNVTTLSDGNLKGTTASASWIPVIATFGVSSGKWYWEYTVTGNNDVFFGISPSTYTATSGQYMGSSSANGYGYYGANGSKYILGAAGSAYGATVTTNDVVGVALDMDAGTITFYKNNSSQGVMASSIVGTWMPAMAVYNNNAVINFGQRPFSYTPPTGYVALNTYNLPDSTIKNGAAYMAATLYTGTGAAQSISNAVNGVSFQPDFIWFKSRAQAYGHVLNDSVRGVTKTLSSESTSAEVTVSAGQDLTAFNSNGFSVGTVYYNSPNNSASNPVAWQWKAGTTSASNTNGSITSTVSVGATQGFSVVTYTGNGTGGATVGHGLGVTPSMVILKSRGGVENWAVWHNSLASQSYFLNLNTTDAVLTTFTNRWTAFSSTTITLGNNSQTNASATTYVAYCFSAVAGYSAFGSYTGNGSTDGTFVYTGFRPRFVIIKCTSDAGQVWLLLDTSRSTYNVASENLIPNESSVESTNPRLDFLSNGIKIRNTYGNQNTNGSTYIYACFAENPFKNALAR